jgi:hypothetical protein
MTATPLYLGASTRSPKEPTDFVAGDFDAQDAVVALALLKEAGFKVEQFSNAFIPASG